MRFLSLVAHLLPVLTLGGLVSGKEISTESLQRSYDSEVYESSEELSENNHSNPGRSRVDPSESQSTTISSISTTGVQPVLSFALNEVGLDRTVGENLISTTKQTDNFNGVTAKQFSDETDRNVSDETAEETGNHAQTTEFLPATWTSLNITRNQQRLADFIETAIKANDSKPEGWENFIPEGDVAPADSNEEPDSGVRKTNPDVQSTVETIIDPISNTEASVKGNSVSNADDVSVYNEPIHNQNSKPIEAVESDFKLSEQVVEKSADTVALQLPDLREYNSSRGQYFEILNNSYANGDPKPDHDMKYEKSADVNEESPRKGITVMNNASSVPCSCSSPPVSSNLYPSPHSLSPSILVPELSPGVPIESDLPKGYRGFEIEPKSWYTDDNDIEEQNLRGTNQFLYPYVGWDVQPVEKHYTPIIQIKGDIVLRGESQLMSLSRKCFKILVTSKPICKRGRPVCHSPCNGCKPLCKPGRIICREDSLQRPKMKLVCKVIWRPISSPGITIYPAKSYGASYQELFDEHRSLLRDSKQDFFTLESDGGEHDVTRLEISPNAVSFDQVSEYLSAVEDRGPEDVEDLAIYQQLFGEAIEKEISQPPEISTPEIIGELTRESIQKLELLPEDNSAVKIASQFENPVRPKASNHKVKSNANSNPNVDFSGNITARYPLLPDIQVPIMSSVIKPPIYPESGMDNGNLNTNANGNMNLNINQNHNADLGHNKPLSVQLIGLPESVKAAKTSYVEPTISMSEYGTPSNTVNIEKFTQNTNVDVNSNANLNHNLNDQIRLPHQPKTEVSSAYINQKIAEPTVFKIHPEIPLGTTDHLEQNVNGNFNMKFDNNVDRHVQIPRTLEDTVGDKTSVMLSDFMLPFTENENPNADVNLNMNTNINRNINENGGFSTSEIRGHIPITIAEPVVGSSVPVYQVPLSPALSSTWNFDSNMDHNLNSNVNSNIFNDMNKNVIQEQQQPLAEPINQPTLVPTFTWTEAAPEFSSVHEVADSVVRTNQNVNQNLGSSLNINSEHNVNQDTTINKAIPAIPETFPVLLGPMAIQTAVNVPVVNGNANRSSNINQNVNRNVNVNSNVNMNSNSNAGVNVPGTSSPGSPLVIPGLRPVAVVPEFALVGVAPVASVSSQVSRNQNINSNANVNYNSNMNNDVNHKIGVPSEQLVSPVIKPVESQPVAAAPKHSETLPLLTPSQVDVNQNLNANANANNNVNVDVNVNDNHNVNGNADYKIGEAEVPEPPKIAETSVMVPRFSARVATEVLKPEQVAVSKPNENTELNNNQNVNANIRYSSNVNVDQNLNLNKNGNIESQRITSMPIPGAASFPIREPILVPPSAQDAAIFSHATIGKPKILQGEKSNANNNANVNINHHLNSNADYNQVNQIRPEPILFPPLPPLPWAQELQPQIIANVGMNLIDNSDVNLNQNSIINVNHNVSSNEDHVIVPREPNDLPATDEYSNKNYYPSISKAEVREPVATDASTLVLTRDAQEIPLVTRDSQVYANLNANVNMNYNSNYNSNANDNSKAVANENENENGKLPLIKPPQNVLASVIVPQSQEDRGTGLWNVRKNSNVNANYNSNMNYNANVNANSNYNSNLGQSGLGTSAQGNGGTRENRQEIRGPIFTGNRVLPVSMISDTVIEVDSNSGQFAHGAKRNFATNTNFNSNPNSEFNYNANYNQNADYNAESTIDPKNSKRVGWYELWYNNGKDKDSWTEIWNNKQFEKFLEEQLKGMKQREDEQLAQVQAQAPALIR